VVAESGRTLEEEGTIQQKRRNEPQGGSLYFFHSGGSPDLVATVGRDNAVRPCSGGIVPAPTAEKVAKKNC